ncbi:2-polyprenyl-6-methoxyphenol hydroxylase-like FAD-dependent oxidoreductase [Chryseobacterium rhizosphaerae]|uniref:FAD-dependent monooxygenase n=1 Tax=Chryseobacterium rhizosphaerae TaxID=395937 RepID=UPI00285C26BE|nr:FAD-dependent monooxygenase [Chryseobacterium rhizosphaerae]MDR6548160.1 2-polyprenyl-6-methoxyphenol hydroxylase-like FAD-dependent oxidoreductase [Chryseobacterium rhizosphaerae]
MKIINTQVGITGAGPAGLTLAHWLHQHGISSVILEARSREYVQNNSMQELDEYTEQVLKRIWRAQNFSNFMTTLLHRQNEHGSFTHKLQKIKFNYLTISDVYAMTLAENYVGLPFQSFKKNK